MEADRKTVAERTISSLADFSQRVADASGVEEPSEEICLKVLQTFRDAWKLGLRTSVLVPHAQQGKMILCDFRIGPV